MQGMCHLILEKAWLGQKGRRASTPRSSEPAAQPWKTLIDKDIMLISDRSYQFLDG